MFLSASVDKMPMPCCIHLKRKSEHSDVSFEFMSRLNDCKNVIKLSLQHTKSIFFYAFISTSVLRVYISIQEGEEKSFFTQEK